MSTEPVACLHGLIGGKVYFPGDDAYDTARVAWNLAVDQRPAAVAVPASAKEVAVVVRMAAECGLRVAAQTTGHAAAALAGRGLQDTVLLRTGGLNLVVADPVRGTLRADGGALWEPAVLAAGIHGRAVLHGSSPDVGVAGYCLGGGIGWYARALGLASNSVTAAELVIGDGSLVRASAEENPELFWALRGGGGSFGVVTALELETFPVTSAYAGFLLWDLAEIEPVLRAWADWAPLAPDAVTTSFRVLRMPPLPHLPAFVRGRPVVMIDGAVLGTDELAEMILAPLRALRPEMDTFGRVPAPSLLRLHMDPEGGAPAVSESAMLGSLPQSALDAFLTEVGPGADTELLIAELRQLGGALGRPHDGGGVLSHLEAEFVAVAIAIAATPETAARGQADAGRLIDGLRHAASGQTYLNFVDGPTDVASAFDQVAWTQLKGIRSAVDPHGTFDACHPVPGLWENGGPTP